MSGPHIEILSLENARLPIAIRYFVGRFRHYEHVSEDSSLECVPIFNGIT